MPNESLGLWERFTASQHKLLNLKGIVQNEAPKEFRSELINQFRKDMSEFTRELAILSEDIVRSLEE